MLILNGWKSTFCFGESLSAVCPSGLRGRIANPLFVGSNPTAAFSLFEYRFVGFPKAGHTR